MSRKKLSCIINCEVYPFDVMISMGETDDELKTHLLKVNIDNDDHKLKATTIAKAVLFYNNTSLIRLRHIPETPRDFGTLAHEIFHVATFIMTEVGMQLNDDTDEAFAHLIGFLTERIYKKLNKYHPV